MTKKSRRILMEHGVSLVWLQTGGTIQKLTLLLDISSFASKNFIFLFSLLLVIVAVSVWARIRQA